MTDIKAGDVISKDWWPAAVKASSTTDILDITNTSFATGSPEVGTTFVAPNSGRVCVAMHAQGTQASGGNRLFFEYRIYLGTSTSGTLFQTSDSALGASSSGSTAGTSEWAKGHLSMVEGLTPGSTYYAVIGYLTEGGTTSDITNRKIIVFPVP